MKKLALPLAVLTIAVSCATSAPAPKVNNDVYKKSRFALLSFYGTHYVPARGMELGAIFATRNTWGDVIVNQTMEPTVQKVEEGLHVLVNDIPSVLNHPGYQALKPAKADSEYVAPGGMFVLKTDEASRKAAGKFATEIGVEAVIIVKNTWAVGQDSEETKRPDGRVTRAMYGVDEMQLSIVDASGALLFEQTEVCKGYLDTTSANSEQLGLANERDARDMVMEATLTCADRFINEFNARRPANIPLPPAPVDDAPAAAEAAVDDDMVMMQIARDQSFKARPAGTSYAPVAEPAKKSKGKKK